MGAASMKKKITVNVIIHMVLIILAVICLFPIFLVLINSFTPLYNFFIKKYRTELSDV